MLQQIRQESGAEMDSLVSKVKKFVKDYGKKEGYSYIFGTGEAVSILYAQDKYDITKEIVKALNEQYASDGKATDKEDVDAQAKAELKDIEKKKK
jgi:outer membrane protein